MLRAKKIIPLKNLKKLKKSKRLMMTKINKKRRARRGTRTVCTLNLSQYFKDSTEKVRVEKLYPEIVQKDLQESIFESELFTTFYTTEKNVLEGQDHDESDETHEEEEDTSDDGQELDQDEGQALVVQRGQEVEDNRWTLSLLDVAQEITIGTDQDQHDMGSSTSCQATEILDPRQWSHIIPREKPTFEYHDLDIHYEIPKEVLQLQIYDYCQWMNNAQQHQKSK